MRGSNYIKTKLVFFVTLLFFCAYPVLAQAVFIEYNGKKLDIAIPGESVENQIVVVAETETATKEIYVLAKKLGAKIIKINEKLRMYVFSFDNPTVMKNALNTIGKDFTGKFHAYPNYKFSIPVPPGALKQWLAKQGIKLPSEVSIKQDQTSYLKPFVPSPDDKYGTDFYATNDELVGYQWWLWKVKEPFAPNPAPATKGIAIIDTGVDYTHPDLAGKVVSVWDYVDWDNDPMDEQGHGTLCAGIAAARANNGQGIRGISPNSIIYAYRVLNEYGSGTFFDIASAIIDAADNCAVHIILLNLIGYLKEPAENEETNEENKEYKDLKNIISYAVNKKGKLVVVAAGNESNITLYSYYNQKYRPVPAWFSESFTVGATNDEDYRASFSNYDVSVESYSWNYSWNFVDIVAPGRNMLSTYPRGQYIETSETSMAASLVAGAAARVWDSNPVLTTDKVQEILISTGVTLGDNKGFPSPEKRLDLKAALGGDSIIGGVMGRVIHGENGYPLGDVKVDAIIGSSVVASTTTNISGIYYFTSLDPSKSYNLRFSKSNFVARSISGVIPVGGGFREVSKQFILQSRATTSTYENWRVVVLWKSTEPGLYEREFEGNPWFPYYSYNAAGMEGNFYIELPSGEILGWYNEGSLTVYPFAKFMRDSWLDGEPVEAFVIRDQQPGTYKLYFTAYSNDMGWGAINFGPRCPVYPMYPVAYVYKGNVLKATINSSSAIREGMEYRIWYICDISGDTVTVKNKIQDTAP